MQSMLLRRVIGAACTGALAFGGVAYAQQGQETRPGRALLVGAGPGAADLLTLRGQAALQNADVVIYDALIGEDILSHCRPQCERVRMGKRGGDAKSARQGDINTFMVQQCLQGKNVVRLKGGDPLLFGRAADELRALRAAGVSCEIVPGVTSAFAAAAEAEIMLTHKQYSSTISTATGHDPSLLDFGALARTDTVILLMATLTLEAIVDGLVEAGRDPATPVAVLRNATLPSNEAWYGTLADIVAQTDGQKLSPSVLIVGEAARRDAQGRSVL